MAKFIQQEIPHFFHGPSLVACVFQYFGIEYGLNIYLTRI